MIRRKGHSLQKDFCEQSYTQQNLFRDSASAKRGHVG